MDGLNDSDDAAFPRGSRDKGWPFGVTVVTKGKWTLLFRLEKQ